MVYFESCRIVMAAFKLTLKTIVEHHRLLRYKLSPRSGWAPMNRKLNRTEPKCWFFQFLVLALAFMSRSFGAQSWLRFEEAEEPSNHTTKERVRSRTYTRQPTSLSPNAPNDPTWPLPTSVPSQSPTPGPSVLTKSRECACAAPQSGKIANRGYRARRRARTQQLGG